MIPVKAFLSVWHPTLDTKHITGELKFRPVKVANKGDKRGRAGAKFSETYCYFDVGSIGLENESELVNRLISALEPLDVLTQLARDGGRVWVTAKIPPEFYEISLSPEEMRKLSDFKLGLSFDVSAT